MDTARARRPSDPDSIACAPTSTTSQRALNREMSNITIDADATAAVELVYDAYVRRIIDDAKESLATLRRANEAKVRRLTMDVRAFATTARGFDRETTPKVWNFPVSATREAREVRGVKARVLRRVELALESRRRAKATTNDDGSLRHGLFGDDAKRERQRTRARTWCTLDG